MRFDFTKHNTTKSILESAKLYFAQGKGRCINAHGGCRYRTLSGHTCIIGAFMPDEVYDNSLESYAVYDLIDKLRPSSNPLTIEFVAWLIEHESILNILQKEHDSQSSWNGNLFIEDLSYLEKYE